MEAAISCGDDTELLGVPTRDLKELLIEMPSKPTLNPKPHKTLNNPLFLSNIKKAIRKVRLSVFCRIALPKCSTPQH